ncbi:MAG: MFS transporter [bacterium]|nr:MFS transporter [bacterium]
MWDIITEMSELQRKAHGMMERLENRTHFSRELLLLYGSRILMRISLGALGVFIPVFFYKEYNYDLSVVIAIFVSVFSLYLLFVPLGTRLLAQWGTRRMIILGVFFAVLSISALYFFPQSPVYATIAYVFFTALYRTMYWVPYHVDLAHSLRRDERGRQLALLGNIAGVILVFVPLIGGVIITAAGFSAVFMFSVIVMLAALVPLWFMPDSYERYSWGYIESFAHLFSVNSRPLFLAHAANGAQGIAILVFWPIYVFMLLDERYTVLGIIATLTIAAVMLLRWLVGNLFDRWSERKVLVVGVIMATTGWVTKVFVQTPLQIFAADSYHNFGRTVNTLSFDAATYEQSADNGRYVDEYTTLKEMSQGIGRILMLLIMAVLVAVFDLRVAFVLAALVALFMIVLNKKVSVR